MTAESEQFLEWLHRHFFKEAVLASVMISLAPQSGVRKAIERRLEATR